MTGKGDNFLSLGGISVWVLVAARTTAQDARADDLMASVVTCITRWVATSAQQHFSICGVSDVASVRGKRT